MVSRMSRPLQVFLGSYLPVTWWALGQRKRRKNASNDINRLILIDHFRQIFIFLHDSQNGGQFHLSCLFQEEIFYRAFILLNLDPRQNTKISILKAANVPSFLSFVSVSCVGGKYRRSVVHLLAHLFLESIVVQ